MISMMDGWTAAARRLLRPADSASALPLAAPIPAPEAPHAAPNGAERVQFFIAGVQKGGTTALDSILRQHPSIQMARDKEVHHFDDEAIDWSAPDHSRLHAAFDWAAAGVVRGEATPVTIYWPHALERLRRYNPRAKLLIGLRHPAFRAFSHWRMETKRGWDTLPFQQAVAPEGRQRVRDAPGGVHRVFSYVERGLYAGQVERLLTLFPRQQLLFFRTDRLWLEPGLVLDAVQDFIGVERRLAGQRRYVVPLDASDLGPMPAEQRAMLDQVFAEDIRRTAALSGLEHSDWLRPDYREPLPPGSSDRRAASFNGAWSPHGASRLAAARAIALPVPNPP